MHTKHIKRLAGTLALSTGLLLGISSQTLADDAKILPGTNCVASHPNVKDDIAYWGTGQAINLSTRYNVTVYCPIVRDNTKWLWNTVYVRVDDQNPYQDVSCVMYSITSSGAVHSYKVGRTSGTGKKTIAFSQGCGGSACIGPPPYIANQLACVIPYQHNGKSSTIIQYYWKED